MSEQNVAAIRAALDVFNETGELASDHLAPGFEMHQASSILDSAGVFRGQDALTRALSELQGSFDALHFELEEVQEAPNGQIVMTVRVRGRGHGSSLEIDNTIGWVWTFEGDKATRLVVYEDPDDAKARAL